MKLLLDQNLSYRLVRDLESVVPELTHVKLVGLQDAEDHEIWEYAQQNNHTIITFDADFHELQTINGFPPKVVWLRFGNMTRQEFIDFFQHTIEKIREFLLSEEFKNVGCLEFRDRYIA
ncbi:MAG: DUF5615 family PIN-like protein [Cyclobacteriaceae bacterium]